MNLIGEGQYNEAYVPLPDGRTIPVTMKLPQQMFSTQVVPVNVNVHVTNNSDAQVDVQKGPMKADGTQDIEVLFNKAVNKGFRDGKFDKAMGQKFGNRREPVRRG